MFLVTVFIQRTKLMHEIIDSGHPQTRYNHLRKKQSSNPEVIGVWCAISRKRIVWPITSTVIGMAYREIITGFYCVIGSRWMFRFVSTGCRSCAYGQWQSVISPLIFGDRVITKGLWSQISPDLSVLDFFLWGYLKNRMFSEQVASITELKTCITEEINAITTNTSQNVP